MDAIPLRETAEGIVLLLHVQPGAKTEGFAGLHGGRLRLRVAARAVDGRANARVLELLAGILGARRSDLAIVSGETSRSKDVLVRGASLAETLQKVGGTAAHPRDPSPRLP